MDTAKNMTEETEKEIKTEDEKAAKGVCCCYDVDPCGCYVDPCGCYVDPCVSYVRSCCC